MMAWVGTGGEVLAVGLAYAVPMVLLVRGRSRASRGEAATRGSPGWLLTVSSGCLLALAARPVIASVSLTASGLMLCLWLLWFVLGFLLAAFEWVAFRDGPSPIGRRQVLGSLVSTAAGAVVAGLVMAAPSAGSLVTHLEHWIERLGWTRLGGRMLGTAVAFMVTYCVIGSVAWRFVRPYYSDPKFGLRLRVPPTALIILLQLGRGLLAVLALAPLIAASSARGFDWWWRFSVALAVTLGVIPLLNVRSWPAHLRFAHGLEISLFALVYAFTLWWILGI